MKTTTILAKGKPKLRSQATSYGADNPTFMQLYCASLTGLLNVSFDYPHPDGGVVELDSKAKRECVRERVVLAWDAAVLATQELEMQQLNSSVQHES